MRKHDTRRAGDESTINDTADAGEPGAGHELPALYNLVSKGATKIRADTLRYQEVVIETYRAEFLKPAKKARSLQESKSCPAIEQVPDTRSSLASMRATAPNRVFLTRTGYIFALRIKGAQRPTDSVVIALCERLSRCRTNTKGILDESLGDMLT